MTRRMAAFAVLAVILVASTTPQGAPDTVTPFASVRPVPTLPGVPHVGEALDPGDGSQVGSSLGGLALKALTTGGTPPRTAREPIALPSGPIYTASATWCAPRGDQCTGWDGDVYLGAVNSFRWGDPAYAVRVWRGQRSVDVTITSFCRCRDSLHAIDLSVAAWTKLEPSLDIGRIDVLVEVLGEGPTVTAPPTDR